MFAYEQLINIFFKLLNFGALMALLVFLFRRYILTSVVQEIAVERREEEGKYKQVVNLDKKGKELAIVALSQEHEMRVLLDRAQQWRAVVELEQEKLRHTQQMYYDAAFVQQEKQRQAAETERVMKIVVPQAVQAAQGSLITMFADEKRGRDYLQALLAAMKKSL